MTLPPTRRCSSCKRVRSWGATVRLVSAYPGGSLREGLRWRCLAPPPAEPDLAHTSVGRTHAQAHRVSVPGRLPDAAAARPRRRHLARDGALRRARVPAGRADPRRGRARPDDPPRQRPPRRPGPDGDRAEGAREDQREHRQLADHVVTRRGARQAPPCRALGADTVMDLSTGKRIDETRQAILAGAAAGCSPAGWSTTSRRTLFTSASRTCWRSAARTTSRSRSASSPSGRGRATCRSWSRGRGTCRWISWRPTSAASRRSAARRPSTRSGRWSPTWPPATTTSPRRSARRSSAGTAPRCSATSHPRSTSASRTPTTQAGPHRVPHRRARRRPRPRQ